ncbi:type II toxin-antitoxin system RelE/ParE family toxin [Peribacillus sp. YIM B13472]|uniref:type II toxin-antitoxin system RelE/ParE family toxin n=1 Tax=Peribacillus sp. YIM B13472 TaxID=3366297 RepID=UPI0036704AEA
MNEPLPYSLSNRAIKQLKKIRKTDRILYEKMVGGIDAICHDPDLGEPKKGDLKGYSSLDISHMRTNYELCYKIEVNEKGDLVVIVMMGPRENFWDDVKRYVQL